jgi:hypothetical protein
MFDTLALLTGGMFGGTVIEKFTKQKSNAGSNQENTSNNS